MTNEQLLAEIREANLTYLMLAQNLIRSDREQALYRLADKLYRRNPTEWRKGGASGRDEAVARLRTAIEQRSAATLTRWPWPSRPSTPTTAWPPSSTPWPTC